MNINYRFSLGVSLFAALVLTGGCTAEGPDTMFEVTEASLLADEINSLWPGGKVPYCFVDRGSSEILEQRKKQFRETLQETWAAEGIIQFTERACDARTVKVRFDKINTPGAAGIGVEGSLDYGVVFSSTDFLQHSNPWGFKSTVAHEVGHVLGFRHEQDNVGSTCDRNRNDSRGKGIPLTSYDPNSIMNYCGRSGEVYTLSDADKEGLRKAYGPPPKDTTKPEPTKPDKVDQTPPNPCEPSTNFVPLPGQKSFRVDGGATIEFLVRNQCPNALRVAWLDFQGREISCSNVPAGAERRIRTTEGHRFRVRSATTDRFIGDVPMAKVNTILSLPQR